MKEALGTYNIPKEVYDSDGDGDENWKANITEMDFEEDKNEGKVNYIDEEKFLKVKQALGKSTILARIAA